MASKKKPREYLLLVYRDGDPRSAEHVDRSRYAHELAAQIGCEVIHVREVPPKKRSKRNARKAK